MASDDALDLLSKMFTYDPKARISVQQVLEHLCVTILTVQLGDLWLYLVLSSHLYFPI